MKYNKCVICRKRLLTEKEEALQEEYEKEYIKLAVEYVKLKAPGVKIPKPLTKSLRDLNNKLELTRKIESNPICSKCRKNLEHPHLDKEAKKEYEKFMDPEIKITSKIKKKDE